ncbi:MAG: chitobiase/beta-hexosaminidase C-terminal domain-containing protein [Bacteroidota bacterium]
MIRNACACLIVVFVGCQSPRTKGISSPFQFQLAQPRVQVDSVLFQSSATVTLELDHPGVIIYYDLDTETVTKESLRYDGPITLNASGSVAARAFHSDFVPSDVTKTVLRKVIDLRDAEVTVSSEPVQRYTGSGPKGLVDMAKGSANFSGNEWMGFQVQSLQVTLDWEVPRAISSVTISTLRNHGSWIFAPIKVFAEIPQKDGVRIEFDAPTSYQVPGMDFMVLEFSEPVTTDQILLDIHPMKAIPEWHDGRGTTPWLFIDEVILQ